MTDSIEKTADELHEEIYGKQVDTAPDLYVDGDDAGPDDAAPVVTPPADEDFKHKYEVLQGKYNTEVTRQNEMLQQTFSEKERLAAEVDRLKNAAPANVFIDEIANPEDDIEYFQKEYPNIFKGAVALVKKELSKVERKVDSVSSIAAKVDSEKYTEALNVNIKDWEAINKDPKFVAWLQQPVRYTNVPKHKLLLDAFNNRDATTTIQFFKDFIAESEYEGTPPPSSAPAIGRDLSPSTSGSPTPSTQPKGTVTREDISRFYRDRAEGRFVGTEDDAAKIESRFLKAVREGKVR